MLYKLNRNPAANHGRSPFEAEAPSLRRVIGGGFRGAQRFGRRGSRGNLSVGRGWVRTGSSTENERVSGLALLRLKELLGELVEGMAPDFPFVDAGSGIPDVANVVLLQDVHQVELSGIPGIFRSAAQE